MWSTKKHTEKQMSRWMWRYASKYASLPSKLSSYLFAVAVVSKAFMLINSTISTILGEECSQEKCCTLDSDHTTWIHCLILIPFWLGGLFHHVSTLPQSDKLRLRCILWSHIMSLLFDSICLRCFPVQNIWSLLLVFQLSDWNCS